MFSGSQENWRRKWNYKGAAPNPIQAGWSTQKSQTEAFQGPPVKCEGYRADENGEVEILLYLRFSQVLANIIYINLKKKKFIGKLMFTPNFLN